MNEIAQSKIARLHALHAEILGGMKKTIAQAIEAGGILVEIKEELPHGSFIPWIKENTGIDIRTAQNYMRAFKNRDRLQGKYETVSHLGEAYALLTEHKVKEPELKATIETAFSILVQKQKDAEKRAREAAEESLHLMRDIGIYQNALDRNDELLEESEILLARIDTMDAEKWMDEASILHDEWESVFDIIIPNHKEDCELLKKKMEKEIAEIGIEEYWKRYVESLKMDYPYLYNLIKGSKNEKGNRISKN